MERVNNVVLIIEVLWKMFLEIGIPMIAMAIVLYVIYKNKEN